MKLANKIGLFLALGSAITADANPYTAYWYPKADDIIARYGAAPDKQVFAQQEMSALVARYKTQHPARFTLPPVKAGETVDAKANAAKLLFEEAVALQMYRGDLEMVLDSWQEQLKNAQASVVSLNDQISNEQDASKKGKLQTSLQQTQVTIIILQLMITNLPAYIALIDKRVLASL